MVRTQATKMLNEEIGALVGGLRSSSNSSVAAFSRMEARVEALEAEAEAAGQLGVRVCRCMQDRADCCARFRMGSMHSSLVHIC